MRSKLDPSTMPGVRRHATLFAGLLVCNLFCAKGVSAQATAPDALGSRPARPTDIITCPDVLLISAHAARAEWALWVSAGALFLPGPESTGWSGGFGAETTFQLLRYAGFPSGHRPERKDGELRWGPWIGASARERGLLGEAGLKVHFGAIGFPEWGTFDLRAGGGYAEFPGRMASFSSAGLAWGIRTVAGRRTARGYCDPPARGREVAEASIFRIAVTHRRTFVEPVVSEIALSLELSPTFFLPPVVCQHFAVH